MNKLVSTALGLAAVGSIGFAGPGDGDGDWLGLDSEIKDLASSFAPAQGDGSGWSALLRSTYNFSSDDIATGGGEDISGFVLKDVDLAFWGAAGDFGFRISGDLDSGNQIELEDAFASTSCGRVDLRLGMFKPNVLRSASIHPENQLFLDRTVLGSAFDGWDTGIGASGEESGVQWDFSATNGATNENSDHFYALRLSYLFGQGAGEHEGARGGNEELNATVGVTLTSETGRQGGPSDNQSIFADFNGSVGQFGFGLDVAQVDDDDGGRLVQSDFGQLFGVLGLDNDSSPYSLTGSYLVNPDLEVAARHEDLDDGNDTSLLSLGLNYYRPGNNAKWSAQVTDVDSDGLEGTYFQFGLIVGSSD